MQIIRKKLNCALNVKNIQNMHYFITLNPLFQCMWGGAHSKCEVFIPKNK